MTQKRRFTSLNGYCSVADYLRGCHVEPKAKHLAYASEILRSAQNDIHHLSCDKALRIFLATKSVLPKPNLEETLV